ncbi:nucleoside 2-deoxyribosyltransferase [Lysinibacillus sphaericus]|uniref:nucleoside 2-deoxyribosyltransferase n=1 Tax=Lysinibacillus sphaericus TaxID=1421 RepID=UPI0025A1C233|nr:nucleoside 2-deoxyribosyltransferase [Lysinibacillus sphaericus]MDM5351554.1 nucleoside 2-deoxyribosyltransferase [Lysinibacillus sphaericus]
MQNKEKKFLLIGEVYTDVHLDNENMLRLGGIFHSARTFNAIKQNYSLAAIAPGYLNGSIHFFGEQLGANACSIIGETVGSPNVLLIKDSYETGQQGYEDILREQAQVNVNLDCLKEIISNFNPTDVLIYPGKYDVLKVCELLKEYKSKIHIDVQYYDSLIDSLSKVVEVETFIFSTSSETFISHCQGSVSNLIEYIDGKAKSVLLKENRGGSRFYNYKMDAWFSAPAFINETEHSVGVGDCFNALFLSAEYQNNESLSIASYGAAWYASTYNHDVFKQNIEYLFVDSEQFKNLEGTRLSWEERANIYIYIAGPDFPHIDTKFMDLVENSLAYHNFRPIRPIKQNGLIVGDEDERKQLEVYYKDINLLNKSNLLIAVLLNDDPGTYVEIGWMSRDGKPVIIFDPYRLASNLFLKKTADKICHSLVDLIDTTFDFLGSQDRGNLSESRKV